MPVPTNTRPPVRRALSIAVQYQSLKPYNMDLIGTHNDPHILGDLLVEVFKYRREDITVLMDEENGQYSWPTRENIEKAMKSLVADAQPGDHFVFHFSGHGAQIPRTDGTEKSGYDEVIWPVDIKYAGDDDNFDNFIKDDEIHDLLVEHVPVGAHFMMVFDCCHSGSVADLPNSIEDGRPPSPTSSTSSRLASAASVKNIRVRGSQDASPSQDGDPQRKTTKSTFQPAVPLARSALASAPASPNVESWAACEDNQLALGGPKGGIFVKALASALRQNPMETHAELLHYVTREIAKITAAINAHKPAGADDYDTPIPELETLQPTNEVYNAPVDV